MSGRAIIVIVVGVIILSATILFRIEATSTAIVSNFTNEYLSQGAQNIAQSGVNMGLRQLANNKSWRTGFPMMSLLNGDVVVTAFDTTYSGSSVIAVRATGIMAYNTGQEERATSTAFVLKRLTPPPFNGVLTTNGPTGLAGGMVIDGRNHTTSGTLIAAQGVYGVWTTSTLSQGGGSQVGGTAKGTDYVPKGWPKSSKVVQQNWVDPAFPTTPDSVFGGAAFGYPEGTLKSLAQSGSGGSQYVTDPSKLNFPMAGITYVELPSGGSWNPSAFTGSGILVVHNTSKNAILTNVTGGNFTGIVIGDDVVHVNNIIIGAVVALTPNPSTGNLIGNGNGQILYSTASIQNALDFLLPGGPGILPGVVAWWE